MVPIRLHFLQHVWFEDLTHIEVWAERRSSTITGTKLFSGEQLPSIDDFDWLVIMGGPMGVHDEEQYGWLVDEKRFIEKAITAGKKIVGVCLGAQLIAAASGAKVYKNEYKEIGWFDVCKTPGAGKSRLFADLPESFRPLHWHGDTFDLPTGARKLAQNSACSNQAFELSEKVIGLQFHLESTSDSISRLIENCGEELTEGQFIQNAGQITAQNNNVKQINQLMDILLDNLAGGDD